MEYILINESKLKITLEVEELEERSLQSDRLDYADPDAKQLFCDILKKARQELGFDTTGYRVLLQLYPIRDGGCELYVTRLGKLESLLDGQDTPDEPSRPIRKEAVKKQSKPRRHRAYRFDSLEDLCRVCRRLLECHLSIESAAYCHERRDWYLLISYDDTEEISDLLPISELSFISEYGYPEDARAISLFLDEYAKEICKEKAIETLGSIQ